MLLSDHWDEGLYRGDRLFRSSDGLEQSITFSNHQVDRNIHIWDGYIKAGSTLIDAASSLEVYDRESLIYPILFNYRHGLEIAMKAIVNEYGDYCGEPKITSCHNLSTIWDDCRRVIVSILPSEERERTHLNFENLIKELNEVDPKGETFRDSTDNKGRLIASLPNRPIDLQDLRAIIIRLNRYLGGAYDVLDMAIQDTSWSEE